MELQNPCDDHTWTAMDAFRLCDAPDGLFVQTTRQPRSRQLCADARVPMHIDAPFDVYYSRPGDAGLGTVRITAGALPFTVSASATPSTISPGGASQLQAIVGGGTPPYAFSWSLAAGLSAADIANPIAAPSVSTSYTVVVSDANGLVAGATAIVNVGLSDASVANPLATPANTTTYTVSVTDAQGLTAGAQTTVTVNIVATALATPDTVNAGGQSQLEVDVAGGAPPYTFSWSPAAALDESGRVQSRRHAEPDHHLRRPDHRRRRRSRQRFRDRHRLRRPGRLHGAGSAESDCRPGERELQHGQHRALSLVGRHPVRGSAPECYDHHADQPRLPLRSQATTRCDWWWWTTPARPA